MAVNKMKKCKTCGADVAKSASKCPSCGAKLKRPFLGTIMIIVGVIVLLSAIGNIAGGKDEQKVIKADETAAIVTEKAASAETTTVEETTKPAAVMEANIGDTAEADGVKLIVTKIDTTKGSEYNRPDDGMEFIHVYVKVENAGNNNIDVNPFYFKMETSDGQIKDQDFRAIVDVEKNQIQAVTLKPGGNVEGIVGFQVKKGDEGLKLTYSTNVFSDEPSIVINLK